MRFLGKAWRLLVGVKDGLVLLFMLLFFGLLYAALTISPAPIGARAASEALHIGPVTNVTPCGMMEARGPGGRAGAGARRRRGEQP